MLNAPVVSSYDELIRVIRHVRNRWRLRLALRGAAVVLAVGIAALAVSAFGMDQLRYSGSSVWVFRAFTYLGLIGLTVRFIVLPLLKRVSDQQVALYIEENDPSLQAAVVSAVEVGSDEKERPSLSPALIRRLVEAAIDSCYTNEYGRLIERQRLHRASGMVALVAAAGMVAVLLSPAFLRHGASLLLNPWRSARAANPYFIVVEPGHAGVARGADQLVHARLEGFDSDRVEIGVRSEEEERFQRWPMSVDEGAGNYMFMLLDLRNPTDYFVEASGVRSPIFRIEVSDLPYVSRVDLEYRFPEYTGLSPRTVEDGGDIAALKGTAVIVKAIPTVRVAGGALRVEGEEPVAMELASDGALSATLRVDKEGFYSIELAAFDGEMHKGSPDFTIEILSDQPPSVAFLKPGRDAKVSSIEEVFTEIRAEDDYGIEKLELVYSVNGSEEQTVRLHRGGSPPKKEVSAGHTFFMEDLELEPGDFVSYFARATDGNRVEGSQTATTDIYFLEVRPFGKQYRQAQQGMGGAGQGMDNALSLRQRQIVAATFKIIRDKKEYSEKDYFENLTTIALMQGRLREQVGTLLRRMTNRGIVEGESDFGKIASSLRLAAEAMEPAEEKLLQKKPEDALPPEQRALQHLQRAEAVFREVQVAFGGGGMGGGDQSSVEDLADLFELEMDKLRNQYETVQRGERQSIDNEVDEALQRLQELARRQQQENERLKRSAANRQNFPGGGSGGQRELAEETEELARRLERLAREKSQKGLEDTARRLHQAASAMRRAASEGREGSLSEGISALDRLKDARRLLEKDRASRLDRDMEDVRARAERIARQQEKIQSDVGRLGQSGAQERVERLQRLLERKNELATEVADLENEMDRMAMESRREQKDASRKLREAADSIRDSKLKEKIRYSKGVVQGRTSEYAQQFEEQIAQDIDELRDRIAEAGAAIGKSERAEAEEALEKTRELVRNLESLDERLQGQARGLNRRPGDESGQQGQEGQEGQQGREGQEGEQGQQGQQGQQAQQGQEGQQGSGQQGGPAGEQDRGQGGQTGEASERSLNSPGFVGPGDNSFQPGTFTSEDIRQFRREFRERAQEAQDLRRELQRQDLQVPDLKSIIERMEAFDSNRVYDDPRGLAELGALVEELKQFEYWLRRELEGIGKEELLLSGSDHVPAGYRKLVEEYYRSLSKSQRP
jgi:hypothetical protein